MCRQQVLGQGARAGPRAVQKSTARSTRFVDHVFGEQAHARAVVGILVRDDVDQPTPAAADPDHPVKAVQVTSSVPEEGKTTLAIALARVVATSGLKVILLDGDLRRSSIGRKLNLMEKHKGLSDLVVAGNAPLEEFLLRDEKGNVDYMPAGTAKYANATDIFSSHRMEEIVELLKTRYDLIIIDTPPVMAVADARIIGRVVDTTIFVVRWDKTPRKVARAAMEQLHRADVDIAGVVLQQVDLDRYGRMGYGDSGYYYHYGRYGKYYSD